MKRALANLDYPQGVPAAGETLAKMSHNILKMFLNIFFCYIFIPLFSFNFQSVMFYINLLFLGCLSFVSPLSPPLSLLGFLMFFLFMFILKFWNNFLALIIIFEYMTITLIPLIFLLLKSLGLNFSLLMIFVVFAICEACLNLSILVKFSRFWGTEATQLIF